MVACYEKVIFARFHLEVSMLVGCTSGTNDTYTHTRELRLHRCACVAESMHTVFCIFLRLGTGILEFREQRGECATYSTINFDFHRDGETVRFYLTAHTRGSVVQCVP